MDEGPTFLLTQVDFDGMTVFDPADFEPLYARLIGTQVSLFDLEVLTRQVTAAYRNQGYVLSRALLPRQDVSDGRVVLRVLEGYVGEVDIQGIEEPPRLMEKMADRLAQSRPLHIRDLERYTLLINDLPGVDARAVFSPMEGQTGAARIDLDTAVDRFDLTLRADNRGTKYNGPYQFQALLGVNSLIQDFDRTTLRLITTDSTEELQLLELTHDMPLGAEGARLLLAGLVSRQEPGFLLAAADTESESYRITTQLSYPFVRSRSLSLHGRVAFSAYHLDTEQMNTPVSLEDLRSLRLGLTMDWADRWRGINVLDVELSQGLDILGARETGEANNSRPRGRSDYTKFAAYVARDQLIAGPWSVYLQAAGQYGFTHLLASEEFAFGGVPFGRAHDSSEITGDSGIAGNVELRYTQRLPWRWLQRYQVYGYVDAGRVWRRDSTFRAPRADAAGTGLGLRLDFDPRRRASVEFAKPITHGVASETTDGYDWRVFFNVVAEF